MNKLPEKVLSVALAASMVLSFAACAKKGGSSGRQQSSSGKKISADTPWFEGREVNIDVDIDTSKPLEYTYSRLAGVDDNYIVVFTSGSYKMPDSNTIDWEHFNYNDYSFYTVTTIDRNTNQTINSVNLNDGLGQSSYIEGATYINGVITVTKTDYNDLTYEMTSTQIDIDPTTGNIIDTRESEYEEGESNSVEKSFQIGDYKVDTSMNWDNNDESYYNLFVYSSDGDKQKVKVKESGVSIYDIPVILALDKTKALVPASTNSDPIYFELDLESGNLTKLDAKDYEWLDLNNIYSVTNGKDGNVYFVSSTGISKIDMKGKKTEEVFNFSWCNINRSILNYLEMAECSEDSFILAGEKYVSSPYERSNLSDFIIVELNKVPNPHAGKTILEMYSSYGYVENTVGDAIMKFNESNSDYFIEVSDRYSDSDDYDYSNINSEEDWENASLEINANMSNQLAMDILNGEGPDLLLNVSNLGQLNNSNYLTDLTPYVGSLSSDKYFTNVIDASKVDGKLYNLPVSYMIDGIHTDSKYAGASGVGFTTKEYEKFLSETLNGTDVINLGQATYFARLFSAMSDKFIKNGKVDLSAPEFEQLAEFVKENVPETGLTWDEMYNQGEDDDYATTYAVGSALFKGDRAGYGEDVNAVYTNCYGISGYFSEIVQLQGATAILGLPSTDGRGPMIEPYVSVAISAQAENVEVCGEFVKLLMSDEVQKELAMNDNFVLNREAFREGGKTAVAYYNTDAGKEYFGYYTESGDPISNNISFSEKNIDDLEKIISSVSMMYSADASINLILVEEMPAYFSGQKDLASVSAIAQDRAQKVIDERG